MRFLAGISAVVMIAAAVYIALITFMVRYPLLEELPDHDFMPELRRLASNELYSELCVLGGDLEKSGLYCDNAEFKRLLSLAREKEHSIAEKSWRFLCGFISGKSVGTGDAAGAIVSDFLVFGDVRDLVLQAGLFAMGRETDPMLAAISGAGILTELFPVADWFPAALKILRKRGVFTQEFSRHLYRAISFAGKSRSLKKDGILANLYRLLSRQGVIRSMETMKHVKTPLHLDTAAKLAEKSPEKLHLAVRAAGEEVLEINAKVSADKLFSASRKGRAGLLTLKRNKILAVVKVISSGRAGSFLRNMAVSSEKCRFAFSAAAAVLFSAGVFLLFKKRRKADSR